MNTSVVYDYKGSQISFMSGENVMVNATQMAKPFSKQPIDWLKTNQSKEYIETFSKLKIISLADLVQVIKGGNNSGTWMHEDVALEFARWLSPAFAIWCNDRIKELLQYGMTATQPTLEQMINNPDLVISLATQLKNEREEKARLQAETEQQQATIELQEKEIKQAAPKVNYYDTHLQSVNTLTTTQVAKEIGMNAEKLNCKLKELGIQYKQSDQWLLKAPYDRWGMHDVRTNIFTSERGNTHTNTYTVWTQRGRRFIIALYENGWDVKKAIKQIKGELNTAA